MSGPVEVESYGGDNVYLSQDNFDTIDRIHLSREQARLLLLTLEAIISNDTAVKAVIEDA